MKRSFCLLKIYIIRKAQETLLFSPVLVLSVLKCLRVSPSPDFEFFFGSLLSTSPRILMFSEIPHAKKYLLLHGFHCKTSAHLLLLNCYLNEMGTQSKGWALFIIAMSPCQKIKTVMNYILLYKILLSETKFKFVLLKIQKISFS